MWEGGDLLLQAELPTSTTPPTWPDASATTTSNRQWRLFPTEMTVVDGMDDDDNNHPDDRRSRELELERRRPAGVIGQRIRFRKRRRRRRHYNKLN